MFCRVRETALAILFIVLTACGGSAPERLPEALTFVPFDYQGPTAEPAWTGRAIAAIAAVQTSSALAPAVREALANRAQHVVQGYVSGQPGALRTVATIRDENLQRTLRTLEVRGGNIVELAASLAAQIVAKPKPYPTSNSEAVQQLFSGNPEKALSLDPKYGSAHLAVIEGMLRAGRKPEALAAIAAARDSNLSEMERAQLQAFAAETPTDRSAALLQAARTAKYDLGLWRGAAEAALLAKRHKEAIEAFEKAVGLDPENIQLWNTLAYTQAFAGDLEGARRSIAQYRKLQPKDANAYDSMGEIYFYEGRFREAEQEFARAFEMDPSRLAGGEAYRAGLAAFLAGDRTKADAHFERYATFRTENKDGLVPLRKAIWLYSTGRAVAARGQASAMETPLAKTQLAIWEAAEGKRIDIFGNQPQFAGWKLLASGQYAEAVDFWKKVYDANSLITGNEARVLLAASLDGAGREADAQALLAKWPLPPTGADPGFSSVSFAMAVKMKAVGR